MRVPAPRLRPIAIPRLPRPSDRQLPHLLLATVFFALYLTVALVRFAHFGSWSWDLGIFTEAVKNYAHLHAPVADIKGPGFNILGDHFSPILALLAPLWWLWPSPVMLLAVQAGLFAWSTGIVSETAHRFLGRDRGLLLGAAYGLSFGIQRAVDVEFHEICFAVPLLAVVCRQLLLRRWWRALWWALPLLLVKEDMGLTLAMVGAVAGWQARDWPRRNRWLLAGGTALVGVGVAVVAVLVLIPHFNPHHHFDYWAKIPGGEAHPHWSMLWAPFTRWTVWSTTVWTLGTAGFVCVRSPLLVLAVPTALWRFTSDNADYWGTGWHYSAVLMPVVFLAAVDGLERCEASRRHRVRRIAAGMVPAALGVAVAATLAMPVGIGNLAQRDYWRWTPHDDALAGAARAIPDGVTVECNNPLLATLAARDIVYYPGGDKQAPQYIIGEGGDSPADTFRWAQDTHRGGTYRVVYHRDKVTVLRLLP
jgi:uncharacterized membrane protein